jgi:hypothetical protein
MDDKTISSPDVAEYKFAEADAAPAATVDQQPDSGPVTGGEAPVAPGSGIKNIDWHKFIKPGGIVLAVLIVYGIFSLYGAKKSNMAEQQKMQLQSVASQEAMVPPPPAVVVSQPSALLNNDQAEQAQVAIQKKLSAVEQEVSSNREQLLSLKNAISQAQQDVSGISQNVNQLTVSMQQVLAEIQQLKAPKIKPKKKPVKTLALYHIRAIVPGRVWLEADNGKSVTLRVGGKLEGYGTVEVISPSQGMVLMSNGSYIQYGVNDF